MVTIIDDLVREFTYKKMKITTDCYIYDNCAEVMEYLEISHIRNHLPASNVA